ncbi:protein cereblon, partial [Aphelenchoides avenae]
MDGNEEASDGDVAPLQMSDSDQEDVTETTDEEGAVKQAFDIRIPSSHTYLKSSELGELSSELLDADPGSVVTVPVLILDAVLLPGQKLPLTITNRRAIELIGEAATRKSYVALYTCVPPETNVEEMDATITRSSTGCLFQILNLSDNGNAGTKITIQAVGRQKCRLQSPLRYADICAEDWAITMFDHVKVVVVQDTALPRLFCLPGSSINRLSEKVRDRYYSALWAHDSYALAQSSTKAVVYWLKNWLQRWFDLSRINLVLNQGTAAFSYWVASNLPVDINTKIAFLEEDCVDRRLRKEWRIASQMNSLACCHCMDLKVEVSDLINLSAEGNAMHFVNPSGFVHDMFTVGRIRGIRLLGEPSTESSWFPG